MISAHLEKNESSGKRYHQLSLLHAALLLKFCIYSSVRQLGESDITTWLDLNRGLWEGIIDGKVSRVSCSVYYHDDCDSPSRFSLGIIRYKWKDLHVKGMFCVVYEQRMATDTRTDHSIIEVSQVGDNKCPKQ